MLAHCNTESIETAMAPTPHCMLPKRLNLYQIAMLLPFRFISHSTYCSMLCSMPLSLFIPDPAPDSESFCSTRWLSMLTADQVPDVYPQGYHSTSVTFHVWHDNSIATHSTEVHGPVSSASEKNTFCKCSAFRRAVLNECFPCKVAHQQLRNHTT